MNNKILFLLIIVLVLVSTFLFNYLLNIDGLIYNFYSEQLAKEQIGELLENQKKWSWINYLIMPILILLRTSLVAFCIEVGVFFYNIENKIKFKKIFRIALLGEFVLILVGLSKVVYFYFIDTTYTLEDLQQFYPFSYINFLNIDNLEPWLIYPLQIINLFEVAYFFVLVNGLHKLLKNKYIKSFEIIAISYGLGLTIWLGLVMFLTLNVS
ncbi:hypothetical protein MC378_12710 [Polaribacter sp. MSW13]|uniref:Uncharacterized protein n=1 Tax=Polaribacter marinus TaxID=2916838 RepID=A0A9X1VS12_9FLAO|nr:hypothetical protein [Polaribacter marinus]MCI2230032.1 hypothetical protein [Polaribacter marinus]